MPSFLVLLVLSLGVSQQPNTAPAESAAKALQQAFNAGDAAAMKAHFADKIVFIGDPRFLGEGPGRQVQRDLSRDQLADAYTKLFDAMGREKWRELTAQAKPALTRATKDGTHAHGAREPLFDHRRLAVELNLKSGFEFTPLTLPFADPGAEFVVVFDGSNAPIEGAMAIEFLLDGHQWRCDLQAEWDWGKEPPTDYECVKGDPVQPSARPAAGAPLRSPDGRWEALAQNHNVVVRPARGGAAKPLSSDGTAALPYDRGSIHWSRDSNTLSAYRVSPEVWKAESVTGSVKDLVLRREFKLPQ